ncbi:hypothetical protein [Salaquimonas pukyongi]|uniref:hypothetical protein n=1 Tax=Salaquimonas pukyongi TaxID=2712698 RepID=UPI0012EC24B4|nr:hypothetical protein [Salaquimonas pukyongi]
MALLIAGSLLRPVHQAAAAQSAPAAMELATIAGVDDLAVAMGEPSQLKCCTADKGGLPGHWRCMTDLGIVAGGGSLQGESAETTRSAGRVQVLTGCSASAPLRPPINV